MIGCYDIIDVSALGNVFNLNLSGTLIWDISALGYVPNLNLQFCKHIKKANEIEYMYLNFHKIYKIFIFIYILYIIFYILYFFH